jgi:3'-phosphoadenosine 5'-phosphosulfate sulfotransferase (PAPS reductase)/FAD synthetase|tara:strand:+ start:1686 stop:2402 length:717 start_codon:yes stop_codon:yes gene_type:complete
MLQDKIDEATSILLKVATPRTMENPMVLFSGGKDSIVTAHLLKKVLGITRGFSESSLIPNELDLEIRDIAKSMGLNIVYKNNISETKFAKNWFNQVPPKKWKASDCDKIRHWDSIPKFAKKNNITMMVFGRRLEENTIPKPFYYTKKYGKALQVHPIYNWTRAEVFEYKVKEGLAFPKCYEEGQKHLFNIVSMMQFEFKASGDINKCFDILAKDHLSYLIEGAKVDERAAKYLLENGY